MPKKPLDETASAPSSHKRSPIHLVLGLLLLIFGVAALWSGVSSVTDNKQRLYTPNTQLQVEVVSSVEDRKIGLSNRDELAEKAGMLFVFGEGEAGCFWMKDTRIPLDIVWLDSNKKVVYTSKNTTPYSEESLCPDVPATYVLEVNGGKAEQFDLRAGSVLRF